ncbi:Willebrand factor D and EGF domain-containing [Octopus vulgaris]|uniref:Willebrand factor D and EGF domain-containing n=1 Tax=Octopus vulgaris TaxID=6645 RepID=A0AA36BQX1_OCTVU|nr:Willebrand factor D and EGF domain-containing [Octopus vulgaris]
MTLATLPWSCFILWLLLVSSQALLISNTNGFLRASSTQTGLSLTQSILGCCPNSFEGWCSAKTTAGEWLEIYYEYPVLISKLSLYAPNQGTNYAKQFRFEVETADSKPGQSQKLEDTVKLDAQNGSAEINFGNILARRIRIIVVDFETRPCFRFKLTASETKDLIPVKNIPSPVIELEYVSEKNMKLHCKPNVAEVPGILYSFRAFWKNEPLSQPVFVQNPKPVIKEVSEENIFSNYLRCSLTACYASNCTNTTSLQTNSSAFQPQIQITNEDPIVVEEGKETKDLRFKCNVPPHLVCMNAHKPRNCRVTFQISSKEMGIKCPNQKFLPQIAFEANTISAETSCNISLTQENWQQDQIIPVYGIADGYIDGNTMTNVTVSAKAGHTQLPYMSAFTKITTIDNEKSSVCISLNQAQISTFDGRIYNNHLEGEFVFYKHKSLPYSVNVFYQNCTHNAPCSCGAAIKAGDDVLLIDKCQKKENSVNEHLNVKLYQIGELESQFRIEKYENGRYYKVILPHGTEIFVGDSYANSANVWVYSSFHDYKNTEGLCGVYDDKQDNDLKHSDDSYTQTNTTFPTKFSQSWRVKESESLYSGVCKPVNFKKGSTEYCTSCTDAQICVSELSHFQPCNTTGNDITSEMESQKLDPYNCYSSVEFVDEFHYNPDFVSSSLPPWSDDEFSETDARKFCQTYLKDKTSFAPCTTNIGINITREIESCIINIQITKDVKWAPVMLESMLLRCNRKLHRMVLAQQEDLKLIEAMASICPNDCSDNGNCEKGNCQCSAPYAGDDCSVDLEMAPQISYLQNNGICHDLEENSCTWVSVYGGPFLENQTECHISQLQLKPDGATTVSNMTKKAMFKNYNEVKCPLPSKGYFRVAVSFNRNKTSNFKTFMSFNPICLDCDVELETCKQKKNTCIIKGECYMAQEKSSAFSEFECNPFQNPTNWSKAQVPCNPTWSVNKEKKIAFHDNLIISNVSNADICRQHCIKEVAFVCMSSEYTDTLKECRLSKYRGSDVVDYFLPSKEDELAELYCSNDFCKLKKRMFKAQMSMAVVAPSDLKINNVWTSNQCIFYCKNQCQYATYNAKRHLCLLYNKTDVKMAQAIGWNTYTLKCGNDDLSSKEGVPPQAEEVKVMPSFNSTIDIFTCHFDESSLQQDPSNMIKVDYIWEFENFVVPQKISSNILPKEYVNKLKYGSEVRCAVSLCYKKNCEKSRSTLSWSEKYRVEVKVTNLTDDIVLKEGHVGVYFMLQATAPPKILGAGVLSGDQEFWSVTVDLDYGVNGSVLRCPSRVVIPQVVLAWHVKDSPSIRSSCQINIQADNWNSVYVLNLKAVADNKIDGNKLGYIKMTANYKQSTSQSIKLWEETRKLSVIDLDRPAVCMSLNDPHMTTFDGTYYNNFNLGEFILYRHTTLPYEVRAFYRPCNGHASCNCAVAIKVNDDVFVVSKCNANHTVTSTYEPITFKMYQFGSLTPGFRVHIHDDGRKFVSTLPTGTKIIIRPSNTYITDFINIWIKPSTADFNQTEGLCGTFDDDKSNDLTLADGTVYKSNELRPDTFSLTWRVDLKDTIYNGFCPEGDEDFEINEVPLYCSCESGSSTCDNNRDIFFCPFENDGKDITEDLKQRLTFPAKCLKMVNLKLDPPFTYDDAYIYGWPTDSGKTFNDADYTCRRPYEIIQSCKSFKGVYYEFAKKSCIEDIQMTDDTRWEHIVSESIKEQCELVVQSNISLWTKDGQLPLDVTKHFCPTVRCQSHGTCVNGTCICSEGYAGVDCSENIKKPPELMLIESDGFCDEQLMACDSIIVYGKNVPSNQNLTCIFKIHKQLSDKQFANCDIPDSVPLYSITLLQKFEQTERIVTVPAQEITYNIIDCPTDKISSAEFSVSLNSNLQVSSNKLDGTIVHTGCFECDENYRNCVYKETHCYIDYTCYEKGEFNHKESRLYCDPEIDARVWQTSKDLCQGLDLMWRRQKGAFLNVNPKEVLKSVQDVNACKNACMSKRDYTCKSINYIENLKECYLNAEDFVDFPNKLDTSVKDSEYHEWKCKNDPPSLMFASPTVNVSRKDHKIQCHLPNLSKNVTNATYYVRWMLNEDIVDQTTLIANGSQKVVTLDDKLTSNMLYGTQVRCSVSICEKNDCLNSSVSEKISEPLTLSIEVISPKYIELMEGTNSTDILLTTSVPASLYCGEFCSIRVSVALVETENGHRCGKKVAQATTLLKGMKCMYEIPKDKWWLPLAIPFKAKNDMISDPDQTRDLKLTVNVYQNNSLVKNLKQETLKLKIINRDRQAVCIAFSPIITNFNYSFYEFPYAGEFLLYHNRQFQHKVHIFNRYCKNKATCTCAIGVQSGVDVVVFNRCSPDLDSQTWTPFQLKSYLKNGANFSDGTEIRRIADGKIYKVIFSTGTVVTVNVGTIPHYISARIEASPSDLQNTEGLCGMYDDNGMISQSSPLSYRVNSASSIYSGYCGNARSLPETEYCDCIDGETPVCGKQQDRIYCPQADSKRSRYDGVCGCKQSFQGADCFIESPQVDVKEYSDDGLCNTQTSKCDNIHVFGEYFTDVSSFTCKLKEIQILNQTYQPLSSPETTVKAIFLDFNHILCPLPKPAQSYTFSIGAFNQIFTSNYVFQAYDPRCLTCTAAGNCSLLNDHCLIEDKCYNFTDKNPQNDTLVCDPYVNEYEWSTFQVYPYIREQPSFKVEVNEEDSFKFACYFVYPRTPFSCAMTACFNSNCSFTRSPPRQSNVISAELEVKEKEMVIEESTTNNYIHVKSVIPPKYFCPSYTNTSCALTATVSFKSMKKLTCSDKSSIYQMVAEPQKKSTKGCGFEINFKWTAIAVRGTADGLYDGNQSVIINLLPGIMTSTAEITFDNQYQIKTTVVDRDRTALCNSLNDPHMTTFDGRNYDNFYEGEFVLYRHKTLPYEVHTFYRKCNNRASCNCGVAIQSGLSVIVVDKCSTTKQKKVPLTVKIYQSTKLDPRTKIIQSVNGQQYEFRLPIGTTVYVKVGRGGQKSYINVWMKASTNDFNQTEGLCGTFDGDVRNDLYSPNGTLFDIKGRRPDAFSLSWRVMEKNSIYRGICSDDRAIVEPMVFCKCKDITEQIVEKFSFLPACKSNIKESFDYNKTYTPKVYKWEAGRKWNKEKAFDFCSQQMIKIRKTCDNQPGVNIAESIENCVEDIKITDDSSWVLDALDNVIMQCTQHYLRNVTQWETVDGKMTVKELTFCINECSNKGRCIAGICDCEKSFTGPDCSISTTVAPQIVDISPQRTDLAKISSVNISIVITGGPFYMLNLYLCHFVKAELQFPGKNYTNELNQQKFTTSNAIFISFEQVECILPKANSYLVFLSTASFNVQSLIWFHQVFSSDCFQCLPGKICTLIQEKFCYIEGECYTLGTKKKGDENLVCDSSKNIIMWTDIRIGHRELLSYLSYGSSVFCALEACDVSKCPNQMSPLVKSNVFILELQLMNTEMVNVEEGGPSQMIGVQSTFPPFLICDQSIKEDECFLELAISTMSQPSNVKCPGSKKIILQVAAKWQSTNKLIASCFKTLTFFNWRVTHQIEVKATVDNIRDKDHIQEIEILLKNQNSTQINRTSIGKVKVKAIDTDKMALCKSLNDPHLTTFDGTYYNNFFEGPFNLYSHTTLPYGVQAFYRKCGARSGASCNCAAAIRSGDDVIVFDRCGFSKNSKKANKKLDIKLFLNKELTEGTHIVKKNNGREYRVYLPTGTIVIIQLSWRNFINIQIQASTLDYNNTIGLCGSFDGNATNDLTTSDNRIIKHSLFPNNFSLSWRVNQSDSLYAGICLGNSEEEEQEEEEKICSCMDGQEMCFSSQATSSCSQGGDLITGLGKNILKDVQIISLNSNCSKENRSVFEYDKDFQHKEHSWPTPSGWTKDKALKYCQDTISNSASGKSCITVVNIDFADAIKSCVEDIKISDGTTYALGTLENMKIECKLVTESNTTFWIRDNDGNTQLPNTIEKLCPLECSNGGKCVDGKCVCPKNKKGMDCSIDMKKPPEIDIPEIVNTCDISKQNCSSILIPGSNFIDDGSLFCYFQQITIYEKKVIYGKKNYIVAAQYLNFLSVSCKLPFYGSFFIRLTNNRLIFSIGFNFLRYEPQCVTCEEEMCEYKAGHCFIDEMCYTLGMKNPKDDQFYCDPDVSVNQWTKLAKYPVVETTLDIFTSTKQNGNFDVVCQFSISAKANVQHTLIWFAGKEELKQNVSVAESRSILHSKQLTNFSLGMTIQCGIQSCFQDRCNDSLSPVRRSKPLFAGFKVTIVDNNKSGAVCKSINDPHMTTFDGKTYNNFFEGEFVLYKHITLPYAVHAFYKNCNGAASCNCAVAALSGDDVIVIDGCDLDNKASKSSSFKIKMYVNGELTPGTRVIRTSGKSFEIHFPTGTHLFVKFRPWRKTNNFMNVWLYPSAFDTKKTLVKLEDTLYNGYCPEDSDDEEEKPTDIYCNCANGMNESCSKDEYIFKCDRNIKKKKGTDITDLLLENKVAPMKCVVDVPQVNFTFDINYIPLLTDDISWVNAALSDIKQVCEKEIATNPEIWVKDNTTNILKPPQDIEDTLCPNECSNRGNCSAGFCNCFDGYVGADCSINVTTPPILEEITSGMLCDTRIRNCSKTDICRINGKCQEPGESFEDDEINICNPASSKTQWTRITADIIEMKRVHITNIIGNTLTTTQGNMTLIGNPSLVDGWKGGFAINLRNGQCLQTENYFSGFFDCFRKNGPNCLLGFTMKFSMKIMRLQENSLIMSTGSDVSTSSGMFMYYKKGKLIVTVAVEHYTWSVYTKLRNEPTLNTMPVLNLNHTENTMFTCAFEMIRRKDVSYSVKWYIDNDMKKEEPIERGVSQISWKQTESYAYPIGTEVHGYSFAIVEGDTKNISISTPLPPRMLCPLKSQSVVSSTIEVSSSIEPQKNPWQCSDGKPLIQLVFGYSANRNCTGISCPDIITNAKSSWLDNRLNIPLKATVDIIKDGSQQLTLLLNADLICNKIVDPIMKDFKIKVTVKDRYTPTCKSVTDPHVTTFDGKYFKCFEVGEFLLYRHNTLPFAVHAFYKSCNGRASCNCGVAVQSGDNVILLNRCKGSQLKIRIFKSSDTLLAGTAIHRLADGRKYEIHLPTGSVISCQLTSTFINLWMRASPKDFNKTKGMCGNYDGNKRNDLLMPNGMFYAKKSSSLRTFCLAWRVNKTDSLYNGYCPKTEEANNTVIYCQNVNGTKSKCSATGDVNFCYQKKKSNTDVTDFYWKEATYPRKCLGEESEEFKYDEDYDAGEQPTVTPSGITEDQARGECQTFLSLKKTFSSCEAVKDLNVGTSVEACVTDIMMTDNLVWRVAMYEDIKAQCENLLKTDTDNWKTDNISGTSRPPDTADAICTDDCNGNGECVKGECVCNGDYTGETCSVKKNIPPRLDGIEGGNICDVNLPKCQDRIQISGEGFTDKINLTCRFVSSLESKSFYTQGTLLSTQSIYCKVPPASTYNVSVSNNGISWSNSLVYVLYDSKCFSNCTITKCTPKKNICTINKECYPRGYVDVTNFTSVCYPENLPNDWSIINQTDIKIFQKVLNKSLVTANFSHQLNIVEGPFGEPSLSINGEIKGIILTELPKCLLNPEHCSLGVTFSFSLKLHKIDKTSHIITTEKDTCGLNVMYDKRQLIVRLQTIEKEWLLSTPVSILEKFIDVQISWSEQFGFSLSIDGKMKASTKVYTLLKTMKLRCSSQVLIGSTKVKSYFTTGSWIIITAEIKIIKALNVFTEPLKFPERPTIKFDYIEKADVITAFCHFQPLAHDNLHYYVQWSLNDFIISDSSVLPNGQHFHSINESSMKQLKLRDKIYCQVSACVKSDCAATKTFWRKSLVLDVLFGLKTKTLTIKEGGKSGFIEVFSTIPPRLLCRTEDRKQYCQVLVVPVLEQKSSELKCSNKLSITQAVFPWQGNLKNEENFCKYNFDTKGRNNTLHIPVKAAIDGLLDKNQNRQVTLTIEILFNNIVETSVELGSTKVTIVDQDKHALCRSINDPHMTTFDGKFYNNYFEGEFVLYRHTTLPYAVHTFYRSCNNHASCNCAVAVQSGDDVIVIDRCGPTKKTKKGSTTITLYLNDELTEGTRIIQLYGGRKYMVYLPTGGKVIVQNSNSRSSHFLNVWFKASAADFEHTVGLCGTFDNDKTNDLLTSDGKIINFKSRRPKEFSLSWRVKLNETLYDGYCPTKTNASMGQVFCQCNQKQAAKCGVDYDKMTCQHLSKYDNKKRKKSKGVDITEKLVEESSMPPKCISSDEKVHFEFDSNYTTPDVSWPTPLNKTKTEVEEFCKKKILLSAAGSKCKEFENVNVETTVEGCIEDVQLTDTFDWASDAVENLKEQCINEIETNVTLWVLTNDTLEIPEEIFDNICINDCNNHGNCSQSNCICEKGWFGEDCSISVAQPPSIEQIEFTKSCLVNASECYIRLRGSRFSGSSEMTCTIYKINVRSSFI